MQEIKIDENMRELVGIIDLMPGIFVSSCCGGHENPTKGQNEDGTFNITFSVEFNKKGRKSLGILTWAIQEACHFIYEEMDEESEEYRDWLLQFSYTIMPVYLGECGHYYDCLDFSIDGRVFAPIEILTGILKEELEYQNSQ